MLVLSRKPGERIQIGNGITVTVVACDRRSIRLGIEAPKSIVIRREELCLAVANNDGLVTQDHPLTPLPTRLRRRAFRPGKSR